MTDTLRLKLQYYIRTFYDQVYDTFGVLCKQRLYIFHYDEFNDTLKHMINNITMNIKEGDIPEPPQVNRVTISVPGFWSSVDTGEFAYYHNKWMIEQRLLEMVERQTLDHLQNEAKKHNIDIKFAIDWERIDPPKI